MSELPRNHKPARMKAYCFWIGPDRRMRRLRAIIDENGLARVRRGPRAVKVVPSRMFTYKKRPAFESVENSGEALDVFALNEKTIVTSTELDELANNNYAEQAFTEIGKSKLGTVRDWLVIGCLALLLLITVYGINETQGSIEDLYRALFPPTPPAPPAGR